MFIREQLSIRTVGMYPLYNFLQGEIRTLEDIRSRPDVQNTMFAEVMLFIRMAAQEGRGPVDIVTAEIEEEDGRGYLIFSRDRRVKVRSLFSFPDGHTIFFEPAGEDDIVRGRPSLILVTGPPFTRRFI